MRRGKMPGRGGTDRVHRSRVRIPIIAATLALLTAAAGCGMLGGSGSGSSDKPSGAAGAPEKAKIKVGVLPVVDVAPLYDAIEKGYFKEQGLDVDAVVLSSGPQAVQQIISGDLDIAFTSY